MTLLFGIRYTKGYASAEKSNATNTNVCPSIHVLGAVAVCLAGLHGKLGTRLGWRIFLILSTVLICLSTLFLKQHSVIDVLVALLFSALAYPLVYRMPKRSVKS